jgi:hypothetical protein
MGSACELECETIPSYDLAFITESMQEAILDTVIQIKRMPGGLLSRLGWGRLPEVRHHGTQAPASKDRGGS